MGRKLMGGFIVVALWLVLLAVFPLNAAERKSFYIEVIPTTATYKAVSQDGIITYTRTDTPSRGTRMSFSGTSVCQVIDTTNMDIDGYFTYQFKSLTGTTGMPLSGTTINVYWKGSNIDSQSAWDLAPKNTVLSNVNARTGTTSVGYDLNSITGVTPYRYYRFEYESGVSSDPAGAGNLIPVGIVNIK